MKRTRVAVLPLLAAATIASGCTGGIPGGVQTLAAAALLGAQLIDGGQLLPPPKMLSDKLIPVFIDSLANGQAPSLDLVLKAFMATNGTEIGNLRDKPGNAKIDVNVARYRSVFGLLDTGGMGVFKVKSGEETVTMGMGLASPSAELKYAKDNLGLWDNAPIFTASQQVRQFRLQQAASVDLRPQMPPIRSQGPRGTCAMFATAGHMDYLNGVKAGLPIKQCSPQQMNWLYNVVIKSKTEPEALWSDQGTISTMFYPVLRLEGNREVSEDAPYIPPQQGYISEAEAPYNEDQEDQNPSADFGAMADLNLGSATAAKIKGGQRLVAQGAYYFRVKNDDASFEAALQGGNPIQLGYPVYSKDWYDLDSPYIAEFNDAKDNEGYHAVLIVGYQRDASAPGGGWYVVRNSWGEDWGEAGYCYVSYAMTRKYALNPHVATPYKNPFNAKFSVAPPPKDAPPADQVIKDEPLPSSQDIGGYTVDDEKKGGSLDSLIDGLLDDLIKILEGK